MTDSDLRRFYQTREAKYSLALTSILRKINVISNIRLAVAIVFLGLLYFGLTFHDLFYALPFLVLPFVFLVREHARLFSEKVHLENLVRIHRQELLSLDGDFSRNGGGAEFINVHHPYTHDLDIFGEGSIFQYINRCNTPQGKKLLAERLSSRPRTSDEIKSWQEAVKELASKTDFRHEIQALGMLIEEQPEDLRQLDRWLSQPAFVYKKSAYRLTLNVFPVITVGLLILAFLLDGITKFAILAALLQWAFLGFHLKKVNAFHQYISGKKNMLEKYARMLLTIGKEDFTSPLLKSLGHRAGRAHHIVKELAQLVRAFDARLNSMTNLFVNSLLLYDLQCVYRLEKWKDENAGELIKRLETVREVEVLSSFGTLAFNHPQFNFPAINSAQKLNAKGIGHPLIPAKGRVVNDVDLDGAHSIMIITGANMAGKSTFLRALGVNVVLALCGAPVCAAEFECPLVDLRSGMRTADSLKENQSYFYAELDRLKSIMDELHAGKSLLVLLDEILKGTNSTDKQAGSLALVKQLVNQRCLVVIATHDLALGELEQMYPGKVRNYSFEASIEYEQLFFDYKLRPGIAQKMNATFLMRKMGIIPG